MTNVRAGYHNLARVAAANPHIDTHTHHGTPTDTGWAPTCQPTNTANWVGTDHPITCPTCLTPHNPQENPMPDQGGLTSELAPAHTGKAWLDRAAEALAQVRPQDIRVSDFAQAAATIGCGYVQLAVLQQQAEQHDVVEDRVIAWRQADLERIAADRAEDIERAEESNTRLFGYHDVVADAHDAMAGRFRAEQAEIELRIAKLAELDAAALGAQGVRGPHADELLGRAALLLESWAVGWEGDPPEDVPATEQWLREYRQARPHADADLCAVCSPEPDAASAIHRTPRPAAGHAAGREEDGGEAPLAAAIAKARAGVDEALAITGGQVDKAFAEAPSPAPADAVDRCHESTEIGHSCAVCLPFLGFTTDGYAIGGPVPDDVPKPDGVAKCGGPGMCRDCGAEVTQARRKHSQLLADGPSDNRCECCSSSIMPVFSGPNGCVLGLGAKGCGHSYAEHIAARPNGPGVAQVHPADGAMVGKALRAVAAAWDGPSDPFAAGAALVARTAPVDDLRLHLAVVHKNAAAFDLPADELEDVHHHDHTGPGGIRLHDIADRSYDPLLARAVLAERDREAAETLTPADEAAELHAAAGYPDPADEALDLDDEREDGDRG